MKKTWMIRAGRGATYVEDFLDKGIVAIGWPQFGEIPTSISRVDLADRFEEQWHDRKQSQRSIAVGQIFRFLQGIAVGDAILTYDSSRRIYHYGLVQSAPYYDAETIPALPRCRKVVWQTEIDRDRLSATTRNSLGAISTLFQLSGTAAEEVYNSAVGVSTVSEEEADEDASEAIELENIREKSREFIKDRINALDAYEFQDLVAGVLRAMGYKTRVAPPGSDRGVDILASPDGFGFEQPRIVVECKHRRNAMGSQEIRSFLGGRHKDDKGLYVSTGGFSKDAKYEAERANIPVTLMDLDQLVDAITEQYDKMDTEVRLLIPLTRIYWPA